MKLHLLSKDDMTMKAVKTVSTWEFKTDIDFNDSSSIVLGESVDLEDGDLALLREDGEDAFFGVAKSISPSESGYTITLKQKETLFDTTVYVENEDIISETGIEDFIVKTIKDNFSDSGDALTDMSYITVTAATHTKISAKVSTIVTTDSGIYNFKTFLGNACQKYGIFLVFTVATGSINISVINREQSSMFIDTSLSEISEPKETYSVDVLAKLIVKWKIPENNVTTDDIVYTTDVTEVGKVAGASTVAELQTALDAANQTISKLNSDLPKFGNYEMFNNLVSSPNSKSLGGIWGGTFHINKSTLRTFFKCSEILDIHVLYCENSSDLTACGVCNIRNFNDGSEVIDFIINGSVSGTYNVTFRVVYR